MVNFIIGMAPTCCGDVMEVLYFVQLLCSLFMCGLIWVVQMVHYPAFNYVDDDNFIAFENFHTSRITLIVLPVMLIELLTAFVLLIVDSNFISVINLVLVILIWLVTICFSVPCHSVLSKSKNPQSIHKLILTNWLRTVLWTLKSLLLVLWFINYL